MNAQKPVTIYEHADEVSSLQGVVDLVKLSDQYRQSAILHSALAQRVFDHTRQPVGAEALSNALGWVPNKGRIFLNALVAMGLLKRTAQGFENLPLSQRFLVSDSAEFIGPIIDHQRLQWHNWPRLDEVLRSRDSLDFQQENRFKHDLAARDAFNDAMVRFSQPMVDVLRDLPLFDKARRVIDLAGGHGTYLAEIASRHPQVKGEVWDLEPTREAAAATFAKYRLDERLGFHARNLLDLAQYQGERADVVMLNDCLHYFTREQVRTLIAGAAGMVEGDGALLVLSMALEDDEIHPALSADFSLHMMLNTVNGELHPSRYLIDSMAAAGLTVEQEPIGRYTLLIGRRAA
ncbi:MULTISPECIES: methyltransferase [unclassified Pseudomonas]|uniref:methyltransferase n=1 Tax=unclassified Pseudomonas TaxID=196821 RepID=UPI000C88D30E|nr:MULTISPECIES: methyltransferase [unclassified Pseudomonas]PMZ89655.1 methyltransferase [Pseudomonas sp. FW305-42]PNA23672.1 methyltransferase [Pseudomonas sp. MPR-R1B]PNB26334.1 methyltransferase [Pseudomonas sp. DP16D-E2]PNB43521.1 methyltransferase [Pseudomonas sp. FW305-17]PNB61730.1 methyltransferase [Pseudomonas sp. GW531-E2]